MSDSESTPLVSELEAAMLRAAELTLEAIGERAARAGYGAPGIDALGYGRLAMAASVAAAAIFATLNVASSHAGSIEARRAIDARSAVTSS